jgi:WD40 repeat protein
VTKDGSNARKQAARELAEAEQIPYTEALRRIDRLAAPTGDEIIVTAGAGKVTRARITLPVATLTTDVVLIGHTAPVDSVTFHPDGRTLVSGGDVTARLWDLATRQTTAVLADETPVMSMALSPDGHTLATADSNGTVSLWTIATGRITALTGSAGRVQSVAFSPDGRTLASSEAQPQPRQPGQVRPKWRTTTTIRLWDLGTRQPTTLSSQPDSYGHAVAFHPGGHILASTGGLDGTAQLLDLVTGQVTTLTGHTSGIEAVAFSPDGRTLATGSTDATVRLWDLATGQTTTTLTPHGGYVVSVAFSPDGRVLASASLDATVRLWDPATGQATATLFGHADFVTSMAFSPDSRTLASGSRDKTVRLWTLD